MVGKARTQFYRFIAISANSAGRLLAKCYSRQLAVAVWSTVWWAILRMMLWLITDVCPGQVMGEWRYMCPLLPFCLTFPYHDKNEAVGKAGHPCCDQSCLFHRLVLPQLTVSGQKPCLARNVNGLQQNGENVKSNFTDLCSAVHVYCLSKLFLS